MPIFGLAVFWVLPFETAMPIYAAIVIVSALLYAVIMKSMRRPVTTGGEGMLGQVVDVLEMSDHEGSVRVHGAIWRAISEDDLRRGDHARVVGVNGLTLKIEQETAASPNSS
jgi:membrane-bound serine protease (ClpP class)